ncbi:hypothetical protein HERIO_2568 [Hepatospora eriocheir]|uniref:Uncharacterized protein n=1 Tax=Hepatospora eriocheir TaxID=1081669 RepID=A0A1X0Q6H5_9MICR|nr:hypothetical protein HERIO_2568 [Hepatospora eriocheir]
MNKYKIIFHKIFKSIVNKVDFKTSIRELQAVYTEKVIESYIFSLLISKSIITRDTWKTRNFSIHS